MSLNFLDVLRLIDTGILTGVKINCNIVLLFIKPTKSMENVVSAVVVPPGNYFCHLLIAEADRANFEAAVSTQSKGSEDDSLRLVGIQSSGVDNDFLVAIVAYQLPYQLFLLGRAFEAIVFDLFTDSLESKMSS